MKKRSIIILGLFTVVLIFGVFLFNNKSNIEIKLLGETTITIEVNSEFEDPGATAFIKQQDYSKDIKTESNLDTSKLGEYQITYTITKDNETKTTTRIVNVIDNISPTIELLGNQEVKLIVGDIYKDDGFIVKDNYDENLSGQVVISDTTNYQEVGVYQITYTISDSSDNVASITRKITILPESEKNTSGLPILMYHFFYDASLGETMKDNNWVEITTFESQMQYLSENGYYFPSWNEVVEFIDGQRNLPEKSIVITADDGNDSYLLKAIPILDKYNIPSTSFLVTSWSNTFVIETYSSPFVGFQSHSHDMHQSGRDGKGLFLTATYEEALLDVTTSKELLGKSDVFCYPFGHYSDFTKQVLNDAGYSLAVTTEYGKTKQGMDHYQLPRIRITGTDSLQSFISKVS